MLSKKLEGIPIPNVINLAECVDRKEYTEEHFRNLGIPNIHMHTYKRYTEDPDPIPFVGDPELIKGITPGVTSSHLLTIKWWLENTDEPAGIFFEDDVDFSAIEHWPFTLQEFIDRCGDSWGALHLCNVFEYPYDVDNEYPAMVPRRRKMWDHGLQCYMLKREYAQKIVDYYFDSPKRQIHIRMPLAAPPSFENNVLHGFGLVVSFPLFNQNVTDFRSKNIYYYNKQAQSAIYSYEFIKAWWELRGSKMTLEEIFDNDRESHKTYGVLEL